MTKALPVPSRRRVRRHSNVQRSMEPTRAKLAQAVFAELLPAVEVALDRMGIWTDYVHETPAPARADVAEALARLVREHVRATYQRPRYYSERGSLIVDPRGTTDCLELREVRQ